MGTAQFTFVTGPVFRSHHNYFHGPKMLRQKERIVRFKSFPDSRIILIPRKLNNFVLSSLYPIHNRAL